MYGLSLVRLLVMIAQQRKFVCRGCLISALLLLAACSSAPEKLYDPVPEANFATSVGRSAAQIAMQQVGVPYRYGGQTPSGFDCSGLVHYSYGRAGKSIPRTTSRLWSGTQAVQHGEIQVGDLLFFSIEGKMSHVGLYLGDGQFVHAPSTGRTVSVESLSSPFYRDAFLRAGRPR
jgi:cell wall-associated NlpC family hydrolase